MKSSYNFEKNKNNHKSSLDINLIIYIFISIILLYRCLFSFCQSDEAFYLTFVDRLWKGDAFLADEWHPAQFYSVILYPFYFAYRLFIPDGTGVYLFFRILMQVYISLVGWMLYKFCKNYNGPIISITCALIFVLFTRANIFGPSYYNLALAFAAHSYLLFQKYIGMKKVFLSGILMAFSVLCMPYEAVFVIFFCLILLISGKYRQDILYFGAGIFIAVVYFVIFSARHIGGIIANIPFILGDPEHASVSSNIIRFIKIYISFFKIYTAASLLICALTFFVFVFKDKFGNKLADMAYIILIMLQFVVAFIGFIHCGYKGIGHTLYILLPLCLFSLEMSFINGTIWKNSRFIALMYIGAGLFLSFLIGSNTAIDAPSIGLVLMDIAAIMMLAGDIKEHCKINKCYRIAFIGFVFILLINASIMLYERWNIVYRDKPMNELNSRIIAGPAAGLYTSTEHRDQYMEVLSMIDDLETKYQGKVLYSNILPWAYVYSSYGYATPTAWRNEISSPRLMEYYELHPDNYPDIVVIFNPEIGADPEDSTPNKNTLAGPFYDYIITNSSDCIHYSVADVYVIAH